VVPTLWRSSLRELAGHPVQAALSALGIALGVAVAVSIDLATAAADRALQLSVEAITGRTTHEVVGGPGGLPDALYTRLRVQLGIRRSAPVVEGYVTVDAAGGRVAGEESSGETLTLLGVDPLAEGPFRGYLGAVGGSQRGELSAFLTRPGAVILSADLARRLGIGLGDGFAVRAGGQVHKLRAVGLLQPADDPTARRLQDLLLADVSTAQEVLGRVGRLTRIDLILPSGKAGAERLARIRAALPAGAEVLPAASRGQALSEMTRAFDYNLKALSLLGVLIGMFLIYNTMAFMGVQRRGLVGAQRALGVTRSQILAQVLGQALFLGAVGTAAGLLAGFLLAEELVRLVTRTINDLYFVLAVRELAPGALTFAKGGLLGLGATVLAAAMPAREAASAPPSIALTRSASEVRLRRRLLATSLAGIAIVAAGGSLFALPSKSILLGHTGLFAIVVGSALLAPAAVAGSMALLQPMLGRCFGAIGRLAARGVTASLSRTGVAIAALAVAVSATVGVGVMIASFRDTVAHWLEYTLRADLYVSPRAEETDGQSGLEPALLQRLPQAPQVESLTTSRVQELRDPEGWTRVLALQIGPRAFGAFRFEEGAARSVWPAFRDQGAVIVSESYAYRHGLHPGSRLRLRTDRGEHWFPVAGVYYAYATDRGVVSMSRQTYERFWDDRGVSAVGIYAAPGADLEQLEQTLYRLAAGTQPIRIRSNREVRDLSLRIFDRTFKITEVLRLLAAIVAFLGVFSALMALQLERAREIAVLRATGLTPGQVWGLVTSQTGLMGLAAGLFALPLGIAMAAVLVFVINRRSFGWTLELHLPPQILIQGLLLALVAAVLAGLYPALRTARASPAEGLRQE
jgi:putative ABC transport system permease protein